jgi:hypothetical protein
MSTPNGVPESDTQSSPVEVVVEPAAERKPKRWPWITCAVVAGILLFLANLQVWIYQNIVDTDTFVTTVSEVTEFESVREALSTRIVDRLFEDRPVLRVAVGEPVEAVVTGLLGTDAFHRILDGIARQLHQAITTGSQPSITIQSRELQLVVAAVARFLSPDEGSNLQFSDEGLVIELFRPGEIPSYESEIDTLHWLGIVAGILGIILLALPIVLRRDWWSVRLAGLTILAIAAVTFFSVPVIGWIVEGQARDDEGAEVLKSAFEAFSRPLLVQAVILVAIGAIVTAIAWFMEGRSDHAAAAVAAPVAEATA